MEKKGSQLYVLRIFRFFRTVVLNRDDSVPQGHVTVSRDIFGIAAGGQMPLTFIFIFIYICQPQVFAAARGLLSGCGAPSLVLDVSVVGAAQASLLPDMWDISSLTRD